MPAARAPTSNGYVRWQLVDNTGPEAPVVQVLKGQVLDRNLRAWRPIAPGRGRAKRQNREAVA